MPAQIQQLSHLPSSLAAMADTADAEGFAHVRRLLNDYISGANRFNAIGEGLFGYFSHDRLLGIGGINRDPYFPDDNCGRVRRVYVHPDARRSNVGTALMQTLEAYAAGHFTQLQLFTSSDAAAAFYERLGYQAVHHTNKVSHRKQLTTKG